ncbi:DNA primase DnaG [Candidatus Bathycorpusculum sp.]|uniref:DNA primase DnaG n=1 Tax=Candidatus Bathycorpusculum sp. TaxID=2994959 RepID=UPI0028382C2F|nr:DNA primase DnaG [Candidatus Termitimicrobium sp.]MCL2432331.1 DNA primase DnaG [Candidatus Termitimicrobium sp.]
MGAVFGQTEGLFGPELDLRELQKTGRIGRIEIELHSKNDRTSGSITIPTSLDRVSTALIAASVESINRVGPCSAKVNLERIEDIREARRKVIIDRAKEILHRWNIESIPSVDEVYKEISDTMKVGKVEKYGPEDLPAGPGLEAAKDIYVVEGRADIINLMRCGIFNTIALEGAKVPESIKKITKERNATALLDGDRGGDLIQKELLQVTNVKFVGRAPRGKEIEECNCKEINEAIEGKIAVSELKEGVNKPQPVPTTPAPKKITPPTPPMPERQKISVPEAVSQAAKALVGTLEAVLLNEKLELIEHLPVSQLAEKLQQVNDVNTIVFDGIITQRIVDIAADKSIKRIVASRISEAVKPALNVELITFQNAIPPT